MSESRSTLERVGNFIIVIGALVAILYGIFLILVFPYMSFLPSIIGPFIPNNIRGAIIILLAIFSLLYSGFIRMPWGMIYRWAMLLILGLIIFLIGGEFGGLLVMIGAVITFLG